MVANLVVNDNIQEVGVSQDKGARLAHVSLTSSKGKLLVFQLDTDNCNATEPTMKTVFQHNNLDTRYYRHTDLNRADVTQIENTFKRPPV